AVQVDPVRPGRPEDGAEPAIADHRAVGDGVDRRELLAEVVAHHLLLVGPLEGLHEAVVQAHVPLRVDLVPPVRRAGRAALVEVEDGYGHAVRIRIGLRTGEAVDDEPLHELPGAEEVIERSVLHAEDDEGVDLREQLLGREPAAVGAAPDRSALAAGATRAATTGGALTASAAP